MFKIFQREVTPERFAQIVLKRMERSGSFRNLSFDNAQFCFRFDTDHARGMTFNLHNVYRDYQKEVKKGREALIDKYIEAFKQPARLADRDASLANLLPVIRERSAFQNTILAALSNDKDAKPALVACRPFHGDYSVCLAVDSEHSVSIVTEKNLQDWKMDFDSAMNIAIDNLRDRSESKFRTNGKGVFISAWTDIYDASRLLLTDMVYRLPVQGDPVIAIPSRNHLFVTGSRDDEGIKEVVDFAAEILTKDTRPLAAHLFVCRDGRWELFVESAYAKEKLGKIAAAQWMRAYEDQKKLLTTIHERDKKDVFVASYKLYDSPSHGLVGATQWNRDVVTLLPKADHLLIFCPIKKEMVVVNWADAEAVVGAFEVQPAMYPERFLVKGFPSEEQLDTLRARALRVGPVGANA